MARLLDGGSAKPRILTDVAAADLITYNTAGATFPAFNVSSATITNFDDHTCTATAFSLDISQGVIDKTTFCSGRGMAVGTGRRSIQIAVDIIESKGYAVSSPAYLFAATVPLPIIVALDSDCTFSGMFVPTNRRVSAAAWNNFNGGWGGMVDYGTIAPTFMWPAVG